MNTALYLRVSTTDQKLDSQELELKTYCERRSWSNIRSYTDHISGAKFSRLGLDKLMAEVRKGKIERIIVFKLDRLGRSLSHLAMILDELHRHEVSLICTSQGIDTSSESPAGRLQLHVLLAVAEFERSIIRERVNAGLRAAKARGVKLGRPNTLLKHQESVKLLLNRGLGIRAIAKELSLPVASAFKLVRLIRR